MFIKEDMISCRIDNSPLKTENTGFVLQITPDRHEYRRKNRQTGSDFRFSA